MKNFKIWSVLFAASLATLSAGEPIQKVTSVDIYVSDIYSSSGGKPKYINVYDKINDLLMSSDVSNLQKAIKIVEDDPALVSPSALMSIAARAYDLGLRDEAAFWFYAGKDRFITFADVIDVKDPMFRSTMDINLAFMKLVGDVINPYAFCDIKKQEEIATRSIAWVKAHPYEAIFMDRFPSKFSDRKAALAKSESSLDEKLKKQSEYLADAKNRAEFERVRQENNTNERFCW